MQENNNYVIFDLKRSLICFDKLMFFSVKKAFYIYALDDKNS